MRSSQIFSEQIWRVSEMPKCPFCGKEINSVRKLITEYHDYILSLDEKGYIHSEPVETLGNKDILYTVSYTHLTLPTNREV